MLGVSCSPFGGIPRNWKRLLAWVGWFRFPRRSSPFGGIPRNWKHKSKLKDMEHDRCSPFGGIPRNWKRPTTCCDTESQQGVPPSGGSLEIGNHCVHNYLPCVGRNVPPSGGSLEIGNRNRNKVTTIGSGFPLRGDP